VPHNSVLMPMTEVYLSSPGEKTTQTKASSSSLCSLTEYCSL